MGYVCVCDAGAVSTLPQLATHAVASTCAEADGGLRAAALERLVQSPKPGPRSTRADTADSIAARAAAASERHAQRLTVSRERRISVTPKRVRGQVVSHGRAQVASNGRSPLQLSPPKRPRNDVCAAAYGADAPALEGLGSGLPVDDCGAMVLASKTTPPGSLQRSVADPLSHAIQDMTDKAAAGSLSAIFEGVPDPLSLVNGMPQERSAEAEKAPALGLGLSPLVSLRVPSPVRESDEGKPRPLPATTEAVQCPCTSQWATAFDLVGVCWLVCSSAVCFLQSGLHPIWSTHSHRAGPTPRIRS